MISISDKNKQILTQVIKIVVVGGAFYFIYNEVANNDKLDWTKFYDIFNKNQSVSGIIFILYLSFQNRFLEILKWQNLVFTFKKITIGEATKQVLSALTLGIFTPNGIGEYAGKALYFEKAKASEIVFLNLICNGVQLILSVFFGILGLWYLGYGTQVLEILGFILIIVTVLFFFKKIEIKGYSLNDFLKKIKNIPAQNHQKNIGFAILRYVTFSHQYYFLFLAFDVRLPYIVIMATIATVYFLASSLPNFQFLDFAVKGSIGIYFFKIIGVNQWIVVFVTTLMWFLNIVIPIIVGSFYVLNFKLKPNK
ncbi:MAG: hypothetical protein RLZZ312_2028 [Bacteroidota bacterium]|jgi:hypothetical protein